eukprot:SAG31_NODE_35781_length_320_cov_0.597285_1_plen_20_part_10
MVDSHMQNADVSDSPLLVVA